MQSVVRKIFVGLCVSALLLLVASAPLVAQVVAHSTDVAGFVADRNVSVPGTWGDYPYFGGSAGYNVNRSFTVLGEYAFMPMGSVSGISFKQQQYGGAVHYNLLNVGRVGSYFVVAFNGDRFTESDSGASISANGYDVGFGGGWIFFCGNNWGIRPEVRAVKQHIGELDPPLGPGLVYASGTVSVFYQFGGRGKKK
jgi:hypothetical protein